MSSPPNSFTTQAIWDLWLAVSRALGSKVKLGGIYANKPGYHNTRAQNSSGNYSVTLPLDKQGPSNKAAALDLTFPSASDMKLYTDRLRKAMQSRDPRMGSVKEFYGTLNGSVVYGLGKKSRDGAPYKTSADKSHLWHIHISFFRADVENWNRLKGIAEVLIGASLPSSGNATIEEEDMFPKYGDKGAAVEYYQRILIYLGYALPKYGYDGHFGDETWRALKKWFADQGGDKNWNGKRITPWIKLTLEYQYKEKRDAPKLAKLKGEKGEPGPAGPPGKDGVLELPAEFSGRITLTEK